MRIILFKHDAAASLHFQLCPGERSCCFPLSKKKKKKKKRASVSVIRGTFVAGGTLIGKSSFGEGTPFLSRGKGRV